MQFKTGSPEGICFPCSACAKWNIHSPLPSLAASKRCQSSISALHTLALSPFSSLKDDSIQKVSGEMLLVEGVHSKWVDNIVSFKASNNELSLYSHLHNVQYLHSFCIASHIETPWLSSAIVYKNINCKTYLDSSAVQSFLTTQNMRAQDFETSIYNVQWIISEHLLLCTEKWRTKTSIQLCRCRKHCIKNTISVQSSVYYSQSNINKMVSQVLEGMW